MFCIVWYHILAYYVYVYPHDILNDFIIEAAIPSLHIGVILFVLISGFYGIKPSLKGFAKLLTIIIVYFLPLQFVQLVIEGRLSHPRAIMNSLMFITNTPYWFIRTYIYLYLCSPFINAYINSSNKKQLNCLLIVLGIISVYFGTTKGDPSLGDGKNLVNFIFLYLLGHTLKLYLPQLLKIKKVYYLIVFLFINIGLMTSLLIFPHDTFVGNEIWELSFPYCSPFLIINATLLFVIFSGMSFYSKGINTIASSMFAVYLIHSHPFIMQVYQPKVSEWLYTPPTTTFVNSMAIAILLMLISVTIDKMLTPIWRINDKVVIKIQKRFEHNE